MNETTTKTRARVSYMELIDDRTRSEYTGGIFGSAFSLVVEPNVFGWANKLSDDYNGGYWRFFKLFGNPEHPGFLMTPQAGQVYKVEAPNQWSGEMNARQFGITCCLYTYSNLSFGSSIPGRECGNQYHLLREWMFDNMDSDSITAILGAID